VRLSTLPGIVRLLLSEFLLPEGHPAAARERRAVVFGFVIDHPDRAIVVDTGVGRDQPFIDQLYAPFVRDIDGAITAVEIDPRSVVAVINSHLHFDHCGQNPSYYGTKIPVYVQQEEIRAAKEPFYTVAEWADVPADLLRAVRGDEVITEGVRILATPGHTKGHQSVVIEADEGTIVIAAQAVWDIAEFHAEAASLANVDAADLRDAAIASIRRLKAIGPVLAYFSHHRGILRRPARPGADI